MVSKSTFQWFDCVNANGALKTVEHRSECAKGSRHHCWQSLKGLAWFAWAKDHLSCSVGQCRQKIFSYRSPLLLRENASRQYVARYSLEKFRIVSPSDSEASSKTHSLGMHVNHCCWTASYRERNDERWKMQRDTCNRHASLGERTIFVVRFCSFMITIRLGHPAKLVRISMSLLTPCS